MNPVEVVTAPCPYCGEPNALSIDASEAGQEYIEDCQVCCRPMVVRVEMTIDGPPQLSLRREDEV